MKRIFSVGILAAAVLAAGCTRIETGEVGVRVDLYKQVEPGELLPGSLNQTVIGDVLTFPVKDVNVALENMTPVAKDNSTMKDFDLVIVYSINPSQVSELYTTKNRAFHAVADGDVYLMYNYIVQNARNAAYKAARKYEALDMADNRGDMENFIKEEIIRNLSEEKLDGSLNITQVLIRNVVPADSVVASANELVRAKNELKQREIQVKTAELEAKRQQMLASNGPQTIEYMKAQASLIIAEAVRDGKVNTMIIPSTLTALGTIK
jgi:regulator of protease activity HflC (stomatin/prohibitin superfamily)